MEKKEMTKQIEEAKKLIGSYSHPNGNSTKVYKLSGEHNEGDPYHVKLFKNGKHYEPADYFTDDESDAHGTAKKMVNESFDPSDLVDEPISFNRRISGKYKAKQPVLGKQVKGRSYGTDYDASKDDDKVTVEKEPEVKRGRGRPRKAEAGLPKSFSFPSSMLPSVKEPKRSMALIKAKRKVTFEETKLDEVYSKDQERLAYDVGKSHGLSGERKRVFSKDEKIRKAYDLGHKHGKDKRTLNKALGEDLDIETQNELNEVLSKDASSGEWIHDFVHSDNPKFKGKTKKERIKMALGAYYGQQKEEVELDEQSMAAMGRHAEREWHDEMSGKSGAGNTNNRYHLRKHGQHISSHPTEKEALDAWSKHKDQRGIKIVHEDYEGNEYVYGINTFQDGVMYKYEVTLDEEVIREGHSVVLSGAQTMAIRHTLNMMEKYEQVFKEPADVDSVLSIAKSVAKDKE